MMPMMRRAEPSGRSASGEDIRDPKRIMPYMPTLTMTPDMSAEMWLGAAGWASGSHEWKGTKPALKPNPAMRREKAMICVEVDEVEKNCWRPWNEVEPETAMDQAKTTVMSSTAMWDWMK